MRPVLSVQNLDVFFGDHPILKDINFDVFHEQILVLTGPGGGGKSTILRTICALNAAQKNASFPGTILYKDAPVTPDNAPVMVVQKAHLLLGTVFENLRDQCPRRGALIAAEQRQKFTQFLQDLGLDQLAKKLDTPVLDLSKVQRKQVMISGVLLEKPALLCLDDPTSDLNDEEALELLQFIRAISSRHATIIVTHNQRHARLIGDNICLIAGGRIQESKPLEQFYANPQTQAARDYIRTGGCSVPSLTAKPEDLEPDYTQIMAAEALATAQTQTQTHTHPIQTLPDIEINPISDGPTTEPGRPAEASADASTTPLPFGWIRPHAKINTNDNQPEHIPQSADDENTPNTDILAALKAIYLD